MRHPLRLLALAGAVCAAVLYPLDPGGIGGAVFALVTGPFILAAAVTPLARGVRPRRVWVFESLAAACLFLSVFGRLLPFNIGPLRFLDVVYRSAYASLLMWLALLHRHIGRRAWLTYLDAAAVGVGASLALWTTVLAPSRAGRGCHRRSPGPSTRRWMRCSSRWPCT